MSFIATFIAASAIALSNAAPEDGACPLCAAKDTAPKVEAAAYDNAQWPTYNTGRNLYFTDFQGKPMPLALGNEAVLSEGMTLKDTEGKVLVIDFWATWCGPCIAAAPKLEQLQQDHKDSLQVIGVSGLSEDRNTVESFLAEQKEPFLQLYDPQMKAFNEFKSTGIPLVLVVSTDGIIRWMGNPHQPEFKAVVEQVIAADPLIQAKS